MTSNWCRSCLQLGLVSSFFIVGLIASSADTSLGQIIPDGTLPNNSLITPQGNTSLIQGGTQAGSNLFHRFTQFSIPTGNTAYFDNNVGILNIIGCVTGTSVSNIDGLIRANGTANLFLINPNGIIFGRNASLDIGGSFITSTASSVFFADGTQLSAKDTQTQPILTVNVPIGLHLGANPAPITVQGSNLQVKPNQNLALVGGEISLDAGKLTAPGGRIELGGLSTVGEIGLNPNGSLNFPNDVGRADVSVTNKAAVNVRAGGGGFITINARNLVISGDSKFRAGIGKGLGSSQVQAGDVEINASGIVSFDRSNVENLIDKNALGNAGNIKITTGSLFLSNDAELNTGTWGVGDAGKVIIQASDSISLTNNGQLQSRVNKNARGNSGGIDITTKDLFLKFSGISATTHGMGNSGPVIINASGNILMERSDVRSRVAEDGIGNSAGIFISANSIALIKGTELNAGTWGVGNSGRIDLQASDRISLRDSEIQNRVNENAQGNSRGINITTRDLFLKFSGISATTHGMGNSGPVIINASGNILMETSEVRSRVAEDGTGDSAGIFISANSIALIKGTEFNAGTWGVGNSGRIDLQASDRISLINSDLRSRVNENAVGNSGGIYITSDLLSLTNDAELNVSSFGQGNPGNINVVADSIQLENQGKLTAQTRSGEGGNIALQVRDILFLRDNSLISAQASNDAKGGNIDIEAGFVIALPNHNNDIVASAERGNGGNININTQAILGLEERSSTPSNTTNDIDASSEYGLNGNVSINTPDVDPSRGLANLSVEPVNVEVAQDCKAGGEQKSIGFFNTGRGGLPPNPYEPLSSSTIWEDVQLSTRTTKQPTASASVSPVSSPNPIVEAQGWLINEKGEVVLVGEVPSSHRGCRLY